MTKTIRNTIDERIERTGTLMYIALLFDTTVHQHTDGAKANAIKASLNGEGITNEMIQGIVAFAQEFSYNPSLWFKSHRDKLTSSVSAAQSWSSQSQFKLPNGGSCTYESLWEIAEKIMKSNTMSKMIISPKPQGTEWEGGTLQRYIVTRGGEILVDARLSVHPKTVKRLSDNGRKILRGIMKQAGISHGSGKYYKNLSTESIHLTAELDVILPTPTSSTKVDFKIDYTGLRNVITAMIENSDNPHRQYPEDVKHLQGLLREQGYPPDNFAIFNHSVLWTPSEVVKNVSSMRLQILIKRSVEALDVSLQEVERALKSEVDQWWNSIPSNTVYKTTYTNWQQEIEYYKGDASVAELFRKVKTKNTLSVLFFMRNCYPHVNENHASRNAILLDPDTIERDLYVMFPGFLSAFFTEAIKQNKMLGDLCKIASYRRS